jgi:hypothetical protein
MGLTRTSSCKPVSNIEKLELIRQQESYNETAKNTSQKSIPLATPEANLLLR